MGDESGGGIGILPMGWDLHWQDANATILRVRGGSNRSAAEMGP